MARQNKHPVGKPVGLSLPDLPVPAEPAAYLTVTIQVSLTASSAVASLL